MKTRRPTSTWFEAHAGIFGPGVVVADLACGLGYHAIAAAARGAEVVGYDVSEDRLQAARALAESTGVDVEFRPRDLENAELAPDSFDVVMGFRYLDRARMPDFVRMVRPGGFFLYETFCDQQTEQGWGPTSADHLLKPGELLTLVRPLKVMFAREILETIENESAALASILAQRRAE